MKRNLKSSVVPSKLLCEIYLKLFKISTKEIEQEYIRGKQVVKFANITCCEETEKNWDQKDTSLVSDYIKCFTYQFLCLSYKYEVFKKQMKCITFKWGLKY